MPTFLTGSRALVLSAVLAAQALAYYLLPKAEYVPAAPPLEQMPPDIGPWKMINQSKPEQEIQDLLKADEALTRQFAAPGGPNVSMFVAFFRTQRAGVQPHSPKVCLPGSGWTPEADGYVTIQVPGRAEPITVNRYVVARGEARSVVYYWYQTPNRVVANEFAAKVYLVLDSLRYKRSDTALVRVIAPSDGIEGIPAADERALQFIKDAFEPVRSYLPT